MNFFPQNSSDPNKCIDSLQESITSMTSNTSIGSSIVFRVREGHSDTQRTSSDSEGELKGGLEQQLDEIWPDGPLFQLKSSLLQKSCFELSPEESLNNNWQNEEKPVIYEPQIQNSISEEIAEKIYSRKLFVGGLPSLLSQEDILNVFSIFGQHRVDWPYKKSLLSSIPPKGYCFLIFEEEASIVRLLSRCVQEKQSYFYFIPLLDGSIKKVQIRPWLIRNSIYMEPKHHQSLSLCYSKQHIKSIMTMRPKEIERILNLDVKSILFVGGLPRPTTAYDLSIALRKRFGPVGYVALSTDSEYNYPKGSGKVLFLDRNAYQEAYKHRYTFINFETHSKRIELKPFIYDNHPCNICLYSAQTQALSKTRPHLDSKSFETTFCGSMDCLQYYCEACWQSRHSFLPLFDSSGLFEHKPLQKDTIDTEPTMGVIQKRQDIRKPLTHEVLGSQLNQVVRWIRSPKKTREGGRSKNQHLN